MKHLTSAVLNVNLMINSVSQNKADIPLEMSPCLSCIGCIILVTLQQSGLFINQLLAEKNKTFIKKQHQLSERAVNRDRGKLSEAEKDFS